jgi:gamma-glutamyltranspeptidase/glutathione hydrolase
MKKGGNAFDAMVATGIGSSLPYAGNLGGGGFMVYRKQMEKRNVTISREGALAATKDMFLDAKGNVIPGKHQISSRNREFQER